jgi:hypothetical protein
MKTGEPADFDLTQYQAASPSSIRPKKVLEDMDS